MDWREKLNEMLPLMGHRNWVLVVDKAFPLQSAAGMTVISTGESLPEVLAIVLKEVKAATHIKPIIYTDKELELLDDFYCPGINKLKEKIFQTIEKYADKSLVKTLLHEEVFAELDAASKLFSVLVLKTEAVLPYCSVFVEFDCGYWTVNQENILRGKMK